MHKNNKYYIGTLLASGFFNNFTLSPHSILSASLTYTQYLKTVQLANKLRVSCHCMVLLFIQPDHVIQKTPIRVRMTTHHAHHFNK